jgi:shikimate dehydrogenase
MKSTPKILGIIGDPVSHSLSPIMHNTALSQLKLPYLYQPFLVKKNKLKNFLDINQLKKKNIYGLNVTIPHKESVIPYLDHLSKRARLIGAVNTISIKNNKLYGDNTDGDGYLESLKKDFKFNPKNKRIIIIGSGGAARAIAVCLGLKKAKNIHLANRTPLTSFNLANELNEKISSTIYTSSNLVHIDPLILQSADLIINTTSMGMKGIPVFNFPFKELNKKTYVSDIIYKPKITPFMKKAKKYGLKSSGGLGMLLYQGALSFKIWTKKNPPIKTMEEVLNEYQK